MAKTRDEYELVVQTQQATKALGNIKKVLGAVAGAFAIKEMVSFAQDSLSLVDSQAKLARALKGTADGVKAIQIAAGDAGVDGLESSLTRLNRRLGAAAQGNAEYGKAVQALNLDLNELRNMDADERVAAIADAVRDSGKASDETARLVQVLGFEQSNANEFFRQGGDAIRAARQEVTDYGLSLSEVDSAQVEAANDSFSRITRTMEVLRQRVAVALAPILEYLSGLLNDAAKEAGGFRNEIDSAIENSIRGMAFVADAVEGVRRVFQIAGRGVALFGLGIVDVTLTAVDAIVNGPIRAINELIEVMNAIPGVKIDAVDMGDFGKGIASELETVRLAQEIGLQDIQDLLMKPLPSSGIEEKLKEIRKDSKATAEQVIADRKAADEDNNNTPLAPSIDQATNAQKEIEKAITASNKRIADSNKQLELSKYSGLALKLKEIELEEIELKRLAEERIRTQFGENVSADVLTRELNKVNDAFERSLTARQAAQREMSATQEQAVATEKQIKEDKLRSEEQLKAAEEKRQRQFSVGWDNAFNEYRDNATNASKTAEKLFEQSTQGMEDAIVGFVKTGKFEFKDLIADMLETLLRSQIQQMMAGLLGGGGGSGGSAIFAGISKFAGMFANGGNIPAGQFGIAGEAGPELITGPATVTPDIGGGGGMVTYNINAVDARSFKELVARDPGFIHAVSEQGRRKAPQTRR